MDKLAVSMADNSPVASIVVNVTGNPTDRIADAIFWVIAALAVTSQSIKMSTTGTTVRRVKLSSSPETASNRVIPVRCNGNRVKKYLNCFVSVISWTIESRLNSE